MKPKDRMLIMNALVEALHEIATGCFYSAEDSTASALKLIKENNKTWR